MRRKLTWNRTGCDGVFDFFFSSLLPFSCRASFSEVRRNDEWFSVCGSFSVLLTFLLSCLWRKAELIEMRTFLCLFGYLSILPILFVSASFSFPPHFPYPLIISFNNPLYSDLSSFPIVLFHSLLFFFFSFFFHPAFFQTLSANDLHFATNSIWDSHHAFLDPSSHLVLDVVIIIQFQVSSVKKKITRFPYWIFYHFALILPIIPFFFSIKLIKESFPSTTCLISSIIHQYWFV